MEMLGRGSFGEVYKVERLSDNLQMACKILDSYYFKEHGFKGLKLEMKYMKELVHPGIPEFYGVYKCNHEVYLLMEFCSGGDLKHHIYNHRPIDKELEEQVVSDVVKQILEVLVYIHDKGLIHLDLKPNNIVYAAENSNIVKVLDFGVATKRTAGKGAKRFAGTISYMAPEVRETRELVKERKALNNIKNQFKTSEVQSSTVKNSAVKASSRKSADAIKSSKNGNQKKETPDLMDQIFSNDAQKKIIGYTETADLWSLGIITYEMLHGFRPWLKKPNLKQIMKGFKPVNKSPPEGSFSKEVIISNTARDFITKLLMKDPTQRMTACEALSHPFITKEQHTKLAVSTLKRLKDFSSLCRLEKAFVPIITKHAHKLNKSLIDDIQQIHAKFAHSDTGRLTFDEFCQFCEDHDEEMGMADIIKCFENLKEEESNEVTEKKLIKWYTYDYITKSDARFWKILESLDENKKGKLTFEDFQKCLDGDPYAKLHLKEIKALFDLKKEFTVHEIVDVMRKAQRERTDEVDYWKEKQSCFYDYRNLVVPSQTSLQDTTQFTHVKDTEAS